MFSFNAADKKSDIADGWLDQVDSGAAEVKMSLRALEKRQEAGEEGELNINF
jgi:hypothetical protein